MEPLAPITEPNATFQPEAVNQQPGLSGRTGQQRESTEGGGSAQSAAPFPDDAVRLSLSPAAQEAAEKESENNGNGYTSNESPFTLTGSSEEQAQQTAAEKESENNGNGYTSNASPFTLTGSSEEQAQQTAAENALLEKQSSEEKDKEESKQEAEEAREEEKKEKQEEQEVKELKQRDQEVRAHEMAHLGAAGAHVKGGIQYSYDSGPDGQRYATSGHVNIDTSSESTPEETIQKMQQVRAAAMAPAQPSPADMQVAQKAAQTMTEAQAELSAEQAERDGALPPVEETASQEQSQSFGDGDASPDPEGQASNKRHQQDANNAQPDDSSINGATAQNQPTTSQAVPDNATITDQTVVNENNPDIEPGQARDNDQENDQNNMTEHHAYSGQTTETLEKTTSFNHRQIASAYNRTSRAATPNAIMVNLIA